MKLVTLLENTSCQPEFRHGHGLSLYLETQRRRILFDMGPNTAFIQNAEKLGIDLSKVDLAILSHGHYDHGGGLRAFFELNHSAGVCIHPGAFGQYYSLGGDAPQYIGLDPELEQYASRFLWTEHVTRLGQGLLLFDEVPDEFGAMEAGASLREKTADGFQPDDFHHEQNLIVTEGGRSIVIAGCAHRGIVNIREKAAALLGREPDIMVGGFHLFQLQPGTPEADTLIGRIGKALLEGDTVYYTGHCTGEYAYSRLKEILGDRLRRFSSGQVLEL